MLNYFYNKRIAVGIDEVGRGAMAGPVVAGLVLIPNALKNTKAGYFLTEVKDSKLLTKAKREELAKLIHNTCQVVIKESSVALIDEINILQASLSAMAKCLQEIESNIHIDMALIDGNKLPSSENIKTPMQTVVKGDNKYIEIACASIVAKVYRDNLMTNLANDYPDYNWQNNSGYVTKAHKEALFKYGVTIHHRKSFAPVKNILQS